MSFPTVPPTATQHQISEVMLRGSVIYIEASDGSTLGEAGYDKGVGKYYFENYGSCAEPTRNNQACNEWNWPPSKKLFDQLADLTLWLAFVGCETSSDYWLETERFSNEA